MRSAPANLSDQQAVFLRNIVFCFSYPRPFRKATTTMFQRRDFFNPVLEQHQEKVIHKCCTPTVAYNGH